MIEIFTNIVHGSWELWLEAALYIVLGLIVAGMMHSFISTALVAKHLGTRKLSAIVKAALFGIPLPLCSCGVLPAAVKLHKDGAAKPATLSFLISTPESGVDSISITYGLLGPVMAIARPIAAFFTAVIAGLAELLFGTPRSTPQLTPCCEQHEHSAQNKNVLQGLQYAFGPLLRDIAPSLALGVLLGGIIHALIPESFFANYLGDTLTAKLIMLGIGIPMYICASASTPIAAAMILKGMSPGTALVFLLAGPATNLTSLPVLAKQLGWRSVSIYLISIAICALACGLALDALQLDILATLNHAAHDAHAHSWLHWMCAFVVPLWALRLAWPQHTK